MGSARDNLVIIPLAGVVMALVALVLVVLVSAQAPVSVEKTASPDMVFYDDTAKTVKFTVLFTNDTGAAVDLDVVSDTLPSGFTFLTMDGASEVTDSPSGSMGTIVWDNWTGDHTVPAHGTLSMVYDVWAGASVQATPYENWVEAKLSTGETISDSASVLIADMVLNGTKIASASEVRVGTRGNSTGDSRRRNDRGRDCHSRGRGSGNRRA